MEQKTKNPTAGCGGGVIKLGVRSIDPSHRAANQQRAAKKSKENGTNHAVLCRAGLDDGQERIPRESPTRNRFPTGR